MDVNYKLLLVSSLQKAIHIHYKQLGTNKKTRNVKIKEINTLGEIAAGTLNQEGHRTDEKRKGKSLGGEKEEERKENRHLW